MLRMCQICSENTVMTQTRHSLCSLEDHIIVVEWGDQY